MDHLWVRLAPAFVRRGVSGKANLQRTIANTGWLFADQVLRALVGFLVGAWVARYLGPGLYGQLSYAIAFVAMFSIIATLGLPQIVVRDLVREPDRSGEILGSAFALRLAGGGAALVAAVIAVAALGAPAPIVPLLVIILALNLLPGAFEVIDYWFQAQVRSRNTVIARSAAFILVAAIRIVLILEGAPLVAFAWVTLIETMIGTAGILYLYRRSGGEFRAWRIRFARISRLLADGWPLVVTGAAILVQTRIDQVMLGTMIGDAEVGQFSVAMRLIEAVTFVPMILVSSVAPSVTHAKLAGEAIYRRRLLNVYRLMFLVFVATALPLALFSHAIVVLAFGEHYAPAAALLTLFAARLLFTNFGVAKSLYATNENLLRYSMANAVVAAGINIALNYLLIPRYAAVGALWATLASSLVVTFLMDLFWRPTRPNLKLMLHAIVTPHRLSLA